MKTYALLFVSLGLVACDDDPNALLGSRGPNAAGGVDGTTGPAALECTAEAKGRSYALFDGSKLEASRANENFGVNRARLKPYDVLAGEFQRVLGVTPPSLAGAASSFDAPPPRWFAETKYGGVAVHAMFDISFEACGAWTKTRPEMATAPTAETARAQCSEHMRKAWSRTPAPEEVDACVDLATTKVSSEPDARRRWSYVCASVLSSSQFLTF